MLVLSLFCLTLIAFYLFFKHCHNYWNKFGIPVKPANVPFGNFDNFFFGKCLYPGLQIANVYKYLKSKKHKFGGYYILHQAYFMPLDLDLIKDMISKNFHYFNNKGIYYNEQDQPISANLFFLGGETWKHLRSKMTPAFTSGKMRFMLDEIIKCSLPLQDHLESCYRDKTVLDIKEVTARFATDIIGSVAFGIECNSFKNPNAEFRRNGKAILDYNYVRILQALFMMGFPKLAAKLHMVVFPKNVETFFVDAIRTTIAYRKKYNIVRNDFMQILMHLEEDNEITFNDLVAQAFVFFVAGFETSSTAMTFCMFELAKNQVIQERVRKEIREVIDIHNGEITYDGLKQLVYTEQVIDETLRKYPPLSELIRTCTKAYKIPNSDIVLPVGTHVVISSLGLHYDSEFFPNPQDFDPERFAPEKRVKMHPFSYLPFGEGPRNCIGKRFGILEMKIGLITLLKNYKFTLSSRTNPELELDFKFILSPRGDVLLDIEKVD